MMKLTCILIALAVVGTYADEPEKMVNGQPTTIEQYPSAISMRMNNQHMCGGTIISPNYIVTAAHCLVGLQSNPRMMNNVKVVAGTTNLSHGGESYGIDKVIIHPGYNPNYPGRSPGYDIGVIKVNRSILNAKERAAELSTRDVSQGEFLTVVAWGATGFRQPMHNNLQKLDMQCMLPTECQQKHQRTGMQIHPAEFCTFKGVGTGTCNGDSGSGVFIQNSRKIIGIVSGGVPCAQGYPDVFTNMYQFNSWIAPYL